jgi:hypothetical protein
MGILVAWFSYLLLLLRWHGNTGFLESLYIIPSGFGTGIAQNAVLIVIQSSVNGADKAAAVAGMFLVMQVAVSAGMTLSNAAMMSVMRRKLDLDLKSMGIKIAMRQKVSSEGIHFPWPLPLLPGVQLVHC